MATEKCEECGLDIGLSSRICQLCGIKLKPCRECGFIKSFYTRFCPNCGANQKYIPIWVYLVLILIVFYRIEGMISVFIVCLEVPLEDFVANSTVIFN